MEHLYSLHLDSPPLNILPNSGITQPFSMFFPLNLLHFLRAKTFTYKITV